MSEASSLLDFALFQAKKKSKKKVVENREEEALYTERCLGVASSSMRRVSGLAQSKVDGACATLWTNRAPGQWGVSCLEATELGNYPLAGPKCLKNSLISRGIDRRGSRKSTSVSFLLYVVVIKRKIKNV